MGDGAYVTVAHARSAAALGGAAPGERQQVTVTVWETGLGVQG